MRKAKVIPLRRNNKNYTRRPCNLCSSPFIMRSPFDRFCGTCKAEKDLFKFAEWLPNLSLAV